MFDFIVIISIIYYFYKKYSRSPSKMTTLLKNKGFDNIAIMKQNPHSYWITANLHGDSYCFEVMKTGYNVSNHSIHTFAEQATKAHYHNLILISGTSAISHKARPVISQYKIEVWDNNKLNEFSSLNREMATTSLIKTSEIHDTCKIESPNDPIQDGGKANSIFGNFWGNKPEKL